MHADIDKRAKVGDVGDSAFEDHTRLQVVHCLDAIGKLSGFKFRDADRDPVFPAL